jgi:hypothetical protein
MNPSAYPLAWPAGKARTPGYQRKDGRFRNNGSTMTNATAAKRVEAELDRLGAVYPLISSNVEVTLSGRPRSGQKAPEDPGVCVYFQLRSKPYAMACDRYRTVADNLAAIAAHIDATRAIARHGVATAEETLQAFQALPGPSTRPRPWADVLGFKAPTQITAAMIDEAYRDLARRRHPDLGGSDAAMSELNAARDAARRAIGV